MDIIRKTNKTLAPLNKSKNLTGVISHQSSVIQPSKKPRRFFGFSQGFSLGSKSPIGLLEPKNLFNTKKKKLALSFFLIIFLILPAYFIFFHNKAGASWWNSDWNYRKSITINSAQIPGDLTNYPMLVSFTDANLVNKTQSTGNDIIFVEDNGTRLNHEIEKFDNTTGELVAWVKIPELDGDNDSIIYMYYGNQTVDNQQRPEDVWDENFKTVQHLEEGGTGTRYDSTRSNTDGTAQNFSGDESISAAKINGGTDLEDGDSTYLDLGTPEALNINQQISLSAWVRVESDGNSRIVSKHQGGVGQYGYMLARGLTDDNFEFSVSTDGLSWDQSFSGPSTFLTNNWYYIVATFNGSNKRIYINGTEHTGGDFPDSLSGSINVSSESTQIGRDGNSGNSNIFDGIIDEVRISNSARSADWIITEYNNQNSPSTFISLGQEEHGPSPTLYLPFDEGFGTTAHDESSNHNDGTIVGATWKDESMCKNGKCLEFDGTGDYVEINDNQSLDLDKEVTLEAWVKPTSIIPQNQTIISKVETPSEPTKIYRSVGPSATTAIAVGTSNAMNITGDRATFATALPDNVGVGDVIQYDANDDGTVDALAFITGRISNTQYTISNASGAVPTPVNSDNNWSLFRAYTSLANAEKGVENTGIDSDLRNFDDWTAGGDATTDDVGKDLVASNQQWNIACYANGTTADTVNIIIDGWTTGANSFIKIYTPVNSNEVGITQRHGGAWDTNKYKIEDANSTEYTIRDFEEYIWFDGLQIFSSRVDYQKSGINVSNTVSANSNIKISNNILKANFTGTGNTSTHGGISLTVSDNVKVFVWNNAIYNWNRAGTTLSGVVETYGDSILFNNTIYNTYYGIYKTQTGDSFVKNNLIQNTNNGIVGNFISSSTNNLTNNAPSATNAFGATHTTGTTDGTTVSKLINSTETFITKGVQIGSIIKNTTDNTYTYVTALDSETQLSIANDIFVSGENYSIYKNKYGNVSFVSTTAGSEDFHLSPTDTVAKNSGADLSGDSVFPFNTDIDGQSRLNLKSPQGSTLNTDDTKFDIGADEAQATQIYRSVAPGKTDALETGDGNAMTIVGNIATFQRALADNIGVGDVIQYDDDNDGDIDSSDSLAFVTGRISNTQYTISNASGGTPVPVNSDNDWSLFRAYTSLANAENGDENTGIDSDLRNFDTWSGGKDLVTNKEQWNIACYTNGVVVDDLQVAVTGWTTGAQNIIKIYTPVREDEVGVSQRHIGIMNTGYKQSTVSGHSFIVYEDFVFVDGLEIEATDVSSPFSISSLITDNSKIILSNSLVRGGSISPGATTGVNNKFYIINSIIGGVDHDPNSKVLLYVLNSTINGRAVLRENTVSYFKNVISNTDDAFLIYSGAQLDCTYCALKENKGTDWTSGANNKINQTFNFVNEAGGDYHLSPNDTVARNAGVNLSNDPYLPFETDIDGDKRLDLQGGGTTSWDIGADEAAATKIYRSVGPGNTSPLATDEEHRNSAVVSSGVVSFSASLPDRVGVGDAVLIDTNNDNAITSADTLLFISGRISSTSYNLQTHTGAVPTNITNNDTYQIFRAYTSLANAESGTKNTSIPITFNGGNRDLVTNNEEWNIACYGDAVDTTIVTIDGWTTGIENSIKIYTPMGVNEVGVSQRHNGKWDDGKYRIMKDDFGGNGSVIYVSDLFVAIDGIQIGAGMNIGAYAYAVNIGSMDNANVSLVNNIVKQMPSSAGHVSGFNIQLDNGSIANISNNVLYGLTQGTAYPIATGNSLGSISYVYNNTINGSAYGIVGGASQGTLVAKNNVVQNGTVDGYYGTYEASSDFNISYRATDAPGSNSKNSTTVTFRDTANKDFRLAMTDTSAKGAGINLSNDTNLPITNDIEGEKRPSLRQGYGEAMPSLTTNYQLPTTSYSFDIGADQISSTTHNNYSLNLKTNYPQANFSTGENDQDNFSSGDINLTPNEWSHLVYKRSNDTEEMYINGSKKDSGTISNFLKTNNGKLYLGSENTNSKNSFKGFLDEVRIYPYARTEAEVKKDTTQGSSGRAASRALEGVSTSIGDTASTLSDGLVGYWKFEEAVITSGAIDSSGNGNNGTYVGSANISGGKFGNGAVFTGNTDAVLVDKFSLNGNFTYSAWVKTSGGGSYPYIASASNDSWFWIANFLGNKMKFYNGTTWTSDANKIVSDNTWHHVVFSGDGTAIKGYVDGVLDTIDNYSNPTITTGLRIGRRGASYGLIGNIDEFRAYNRALSEDEVKQLYNYAPAPILHLKMDEKSGTTAYDSSGNNNHGTLVNSPVWETGKVGSSLNFNGSNIVKKESFALPLVGSFSAWVKSDFNELTEGVDHIIVSDGSGGTPYFRLRYQGGTHRYILYTGGVTIALSPETSDIVGWWHVSAVWDSGGSKLYKDGKLWGSASGNAINSGGVNTIFGSVSTNYSTFAITDAWKGNIDDIRIYNYARTQEQILEDMGAQNSSIIGSEGNTLKKPILDLNFNEGQGTTAYDSSGPPTGGGNNGTLNAGGGGTNATTTAMWDKGGKKGGAIEFDNLNDYVNAGSNINIANKSFTISSWAKRNGSADADYIAGQGIANDNVGLHYGFRAGNTFTCSFVANDLDATIVSDTDWHHWVCSYNADTNLRIIYRDGEEIARGTATADYQGSGVFNIGARYSAAESFFGGLIDEFKLYNYDLSQDEIRTLYNGSSAMAMGTDESRNNNGTEVTGANKDYCVPGDSAKCDKPVLELKLDEKSGTTAYDSSGNGYDTTLNSAAWATGKIGGGVNFPASTGTALVQNSSDLTDNWGAITIGAWVKTDAPTSTSGPLYISKERSGFGGWILLKDRNNATGKFMFRFDNQASTTYLISSTNIWPTDLGWHYVSVTYDGSYLRMYGDGQQIATPLAATGTLRDLTHQVCLGGGWGGSNCGNADTIEKSIDDIKIYNYARTPAQIAWDYNRGKEINRWKFDEGSGNIVHDKTESRNNGTITGATWKNESECKTGKCLYFNGLDETRVEANTQNAMNSFSACAWVKANAYTNADNDTSVSIFYKFWSLEILNSGLLKFEIAMQSGGYPSVITSNPISLNEWHRICGVHYAIGTGPEIFMDGIKQTPSVQSGGSGTRYDESGLDLYIGSTSNIWGGNFNGYIDDPKIYNYALSPLQVQQDYNGGSVNFR